MSRNLSRALENVRERRTYFSGSVRIEFHPRELL